MSFIGERMRHFLIPWIFTLLSGTSLVFAQQPQQTLTDLHNLLLQGAPYRPLFERISPLDGLHVLHQAVAVTPLPENHSANRLDILGLPTQAPYVFNSNQRFLTVTVPNPLYNPNLLSQPLPSSYIPEANRKTAADIVKSLPRAISTALLNSSESKPHAVEIPNKGGFGTTDDSSSLEVPEDGGNNHLSITKLEDNVEPPKAAIKPEISSEEKSEVFVSSTLPSTTTTAPTTTTTTTIIKTTKAATTIVTKPPTTIKTTTSTKISEKHPLNLTHHLNTTNLESFLSTANISANEANVFIKLVEKVLEEEVAKRLEKHEEKVRKHPSQESSSFSSSIEDASAPKLAGIKLQSTDVQTSIDTPDDIKYLNEEYIEAPPESSSDRHELKTVDTRLVYQAKAIDYDDESTTIAPTTTATYKPYFTRMMTPALSIRTGDMIKLPRRIHSTTSLNLEQARIASGLKKSAQITDDYRVREQAEFDQIIKGYQLSGFDNLPTTLAPTTRTPRREVIAESNYVPRPIPRVSTHQTQFERLAKDYQYRLSGTNGINDFIKALQNAKIGFYERPAYQRYPKRNV